MRTRFLRLLLVLAVVITAALPSAGFSQDAGAEEPSPRVFADSHLHYLSFAQETDGFPALIEAMDEAGIEKAAIFGMPMAKMWGEHDPIRPTSSLESDGRAYYYSATDFIVAEELLAQPQAVQERFFPFVGGINPLDLNAVDHIERLLNYYPGFWKGIGELMSRHGELTALTYGEPPRADHPALMRIYALAAKYELPVLIHHNITSWKRNDPIFLAEMENAVKSNPDTTFIWAHAGTSLHLVVPTLADEMRRMLDAYPNLNIDISWVVWEDYIYKDGTVQPEWVALLEDFPERVLIGSDAVGHWATYGKEITKYQPILEALTPETASKVGGGNFLRIMGAVPNAR